MKRKLDLPDAAAPRGADDDARLHAPSAERNVGPIGDLLAELAPTSGRALEIAAGSGQHAVAFARRFPELDWQPSDSDPLRLASIAAWRNREELSNLRAPVALDAASPGWSANWSGQDLILVVNLLHLISAPEAHTLVAEAAQALTPGGMLVIYGPFMRAGELTSDGDRRFHAALQAQDADIGYKDDFDTLDMMLAAGLEVAWVIEMPANNLALLATKSR